MLKAVAFLYVFHIVYTGVFTGVMISAILLKINYIRGLYVMNELVKEIEQLKKEKNAVILAHYYVNDEVQEIAVTLTIWQKWQERLTQRLSFSAVCHLWAKARKFLTRTKLF